MYKPYIQLMNIGAVSLDKFKTLLIISRALWGVPSFEKNPTTTTTTTTTKTGFRRLLTIFPPDGQKRTPWKINMEPKSHPIGKENHLNQTSITVFHVNLPGCMQEKQNLLPTLRVSGVNSHFPTLPASIPPVEDAPHRSSEPVGPGTTHVDSETLPGSIGEVAEVGRGGTAPGRSCDLTSTPGLPNTLGLEVSGGPPKKSYSKKSFSAGMTGRLGQ